MSTQELTLVELEPAELENINGGVGAVAGLFLFGAGAMLGAGLVIGAAYVAYRLLS